MFNTLFNIMHRHIDIHTHKETSKKQFILEVRSISLHQQRVPQTGIVSVGWHPWFIEKSSKDQIEASLRECVMKKQVIAIGECGIDRVIKYPIEQQISIFELHIKLAMENNKPLIIHSVKAYADVLHSLKKLQFKLPVIFHGYSGNQQQTKELLKLNSYFSFGSNLTHDNKKITDTFSFIPFDRIFLETDESSLSIEKIYLRAAMLRNVSLQELSEQINLNFYTVFGDGLVK